MNIMNNKKAIFQIMKHGMARSSSTLKTEFADERSDLATSSFQFHAPGALADRPHWTTVEVTIHQGSQVDNKPETTDTVDFSIAGDSYRIQEKCDDSCGSVSYSLRKYTASGVLLNKDLDGLQFNSKLGPDPEGNGNFTIRP